MQQGLISASDQEINCRKVEILSELPVYDKFRYPSSFMDYAGDSGKLDGLSCLVKLRNSDHRVLIRQFQGC